jgi:hypothetical protein
VPASAAALVGDVRLELDDGAAGRIGRPIDENEVPPREFRRELVEQPGIGGRIRLDANDLETFGQIEGGILPVRDADVHDQAAVDLSIRHAIPDHRGHMKASAS